MCFTVVTIFFGVGNEVFTTLQNFNRNILSNNTKAFKTLYCKRSVTILENKLNKLGLKIYNQKQDLTLNVNKSYCYRQYLLLFASRFIEIIIFSMRFRLKTRLHCRSWCESHKQLFEYVRI